MVIRIERKKIRDIRVIYVLTNAEDREVSKTMAAYRRALPIRSQESIEKI